MGASLLAMVRVHRWHHGMGRMAAWLAQALLCVMATINTYLYRQQDGAIPDAFWVKTVMMHSAGADVRREVVSCTRAAFLLA